MGEDENWDFVIALCVLVVPLVLVSVVESSCMRKSSF